MYHFYLVNMEVIFYMKINFFVDSKVTTDINIITIYIDILKSNIIIHFIEALS